MLGVGLIGAGSWGEKLARAFSRVGRAEVRLVCDTSAEARERASAAHPRAHVTDDFDAAVRDAVDRHGMRAVLIATPPATHAELALKAVHAGQDVFLEKPMALSLGEASELERAASSSGRRVMVGHILEYHPAVIELRRRIVAGELGDVQLVVSERLGASSRPNESAWWSLAPHDVSAIRFLLGCEIARVTASAVDRGVVAARIDCDAGPSALVELSLVHDEKVRRLVVAGSERVAVFDDLARDQLQLFDLSASEQRAIAELSARAREFQPPAEPVAERLDGFSPEKWLPRRSGRPIEVGRREPLLEEASHFVSAVLDDRPIASDAKSGRLVVAALDAGASSIAASGETWNVRMGSA